MKHTPGPWSVFDHSWSDCSITAPNFDHAICSLDINHATEESQEADAAQMLANARLIAAAPALLEALEGVINFLDDSNRLLSDSCAADVANNARAAIKAAKGEA